jgi:uncharacterized protein YceK
MKKIFLIFAVSAFTFLTGCSTMNSVDRAGGATVNAGSKLVSNTGSAVGSVVNGSVGLLTGQNMHHQNQNNRTY